MTKKELYERLDERLREPARADEIDQALWQQAGVTRAILVSDMTGFTRLTRQHGILYFLSQFRRAMCVAEPIFARHGARFQKTDADNFLVTFDDVEAALAAARELGTQQFDEVRSCLGVGYGRVLQLDDDLFGDEVNVTYKLGEDVAEGGEVLVTEAAAARARGAALDGPRRMALGGLELTYFRLR